VQQSIESAFDNIGISGLHITTDRRNCSTCHGWERSPSSTARGLSRAYVRLSQGSP
jgi:hypothetical protein